MVLLDIIREKGFVIMTVFVKDTANSILSGLSKMKAAMIEDYEGWGEKSEIHDKMSKEYAEKLTVTYGKKYIKLVNGFGGGVSAFIVGTDDDKKFKKGDILKPAGWAAPARNAARGNILYGGYPINWTGPVYLK